MSQQHVFRVIFFNQGKIYELYARRVLQSQMYGFVEVEELLFGERSELLVDPSEEKLKDEFSSVKRTFIPMHSVVRVDEVEKVGVGKVREGGDKVTPFPGPYYAPGESAKKD
jgi:hypothetical protein